MPRLLLALALALLPLVACGEGDSFEKAFEESVVALEDLVDVLEDVQDPASARESQPRLEAVVAHTEEVYAHMDALGEPPAKELRELEARYDARMLAAIRRFLQETQRLSEDPELQPFLQSTMATLRTLD